VEAAFGTVLFVVMIVAVVVAVFTFAGTGKQYESIGKGGFSLDVPDRSRAPLRDTPAARAEREAEIRQMVEAKSDRRQARGEAPLDVDAEVASLLRPAEPVRDDALRDEVRQLVIAGNERRSRRGEAPLDVEQEVERQLRDLGA